MFRIHAGAFGGMLVKLIYLALGLGLSFVCTTGVDIWLAKAAARGRVYPRFHSVWTSFVWAAPTMLAIASTLYLLWHVPPVIVFWSGLGLLSLMAIWIPQKIVHWLAPLATGIAVLILPAAHLLRFGADATTSVALAINAGFAVSALTLIALGLRNSFRTRTLPAAVDRGMN